MPQINTSQIQSNFDAQLARLYYIVNYTPNDVLSYALSGIDLNDVGVIVVENVDSLPNLQYGTPNFLPDGMLYYIESLGIIVVSSSNTWLSLDGTVIRTDTQTNMIWAWGNNSCGGLGDNTTVSKSSPVSVVGGFTDWCHVAGGTYFALGIRKTGTLWTWGFNNCGQLGDNTIVNKSSPVLVVGGFTDWCQTSAGNYQSVGLRTNGTIWAWGRNQYGQLGDNSSTNRSSPVSVVGGFTDWCQISAGANANHSLGVRQNGTAWAWGRNNCGQLGDNTGGISCSRSSPVSVVGGFTDWCQISGGYNHTVAIRQNGTAWAWGRNSDGQIGDNTSVSKSSPVAVVGGFCNWCQIAAGGNHSLGVRQNGTAWAWGQNNCGQLGDNTVVNKSSPVSVVGGFTNWWKMSAGCFFSLAIRQNGSLWAWGCNTPGALGDNTSISKSSPVSVVGRLNTWYQISAGRLSSFGVTYLD